MEKMDINTVRLGFLGHAAFRNGEAYRGGLLITDGSGKPVEFRSTTPVKPNVLQRTLYGSSMMTHIATQLLGVSVQPGMTKGQASDIIDKLFAVPEKKQSWEAAKSSNMASFKGTPLYEFILRMRDESAEEVDDETLDEALECIADNEHERLINEIEEMGNRPCPKCNYVIRFGATKCPKCGHYSEGD